MDREFLDLYNRELQVLTEQAGEFAADYPGIAERLGGLVGARSDPMVGGLLEGTAFLAARVQLKLKHEFPEFTANLLEQLVPNYLAPTPSALMVRFTPPWSSPALRDGRRVPRGSFFDATYVERVRRIACRFRSSADVTLWPLEITAAQYLPGAAPLQALGVTVPAAAGLRLTLTLRTADDPANEPTDEAVAKQPALWLSACRALDELPLHFMGLPTDAVALLAQALDERTRVYLRHVDRTGRTIVQAAPTGPIAPLGMDLDEALLPNDGRVFRGFELLREYFMLPRKFLGVRFTGLKSLLAGVDARTVDIVLTFAERQPSLAASTGPASVALYAVPAVNLFEKNCDRVPVGTDQHEYHVVPDRTRWLEYEPHRILEVMAHIPGQAEKRPVLPLHSAPAGLPSAHGLFFTARRLPRRRTAAERRAGAKADYLGTDLFLSLAGAQAGVKELSVRALCSNRHLAEHLPTGESGADFRLLDDATLVIHCIDGPTRPREPVYTALRARGETATTGTVAWRLVNMLSLNHLGLAGEGAGRDGAALREMLALLIDPVDAASERQVEGVRRVESRAVVRRVRQRGGIGAARGTEITVTLQESAFEGSGAFLLGAVLDRFFAEYAGFNHFTQTVIRTVERGEIKRWPVRLGRRSPL